MDTLGIFAAYFGVQDRQHTQQAFAELLGESDESDQYDSHVARLHSPMFQGEIVSTKSILALSATMLVIGGMAAFFLYFYPNGRIDVSHVLFASESPHPPLVDPISPAPALASAGDGPTVLWTQHNRAAPTHVVVAAANPQPLLMDPISPTPALASAGDVPPVMWTPHDRAAPTLSERRSTPSPVASMASSMMGQQIALHTPSGTVKNIISSSTSIAVTTSTVTTTTLTTTMESEAKFFQRVKTEFPPPANWSCEKNCPKCLRWFQRPKPGALASDLNGHEIPSVCYDYPGGLHRVFAIGDWGGVIGKDGVVRPADRRNPKTFPAGTRFFVHGVDDSAQQRVAHQMQKRAAVTKPDYILNIGDAFYWGGIEGHCGEPAWKVIYKEQWQKVFEEIYRGPGIDGINWLGILGNHDYGGYTFTGAWDQQISYTWSKKSRWLMPAQFWKVKVYYPGFSVEYFFLDTNHFDTWPPADEPAHNLCNNVHNVANAGCGNEGPTDLGNCLLWFANLWEKQVAWLETSLASSTADWQILVTHFPPRFGQPYWIDIAARHGVDLIVAGHQHNQALFHLGEDNPLKPTAWLITGGGGGITSEAVPDKYGNDVQYGFFEFTLTAKEIRIICISHGGQEVLETFLRQRSRANPRG